VKALLTVAAALACSTAAHAQVLDSMPPADSGPRAPIRAVAPCVVQRIVDGDTIRCRDIGLVRFIGVDSPEPTQRPFGAMASGGLAAMLSAGDTVQLEPDVEERDRYRRILAYVWRDGSMLNWRMVRLGWAVVLTYRPNVQYEDLFVSAQAIARDERRGLWGIDAFVCPPVQRRRRAC
jgi:micrococcal nuclease